MKRGNSTRIRYLLYTFEMEVFSLRRLRTGGGPSSVEVESQSKGLIGGLIRTKSTMRDVGDTRPVTLHGGSRMKLRPGYRGRRPSRQSSVGSRESKSC